MKAAMNNADAPTFSLPEMQWHSQGCYRYITQRWSIADMGIPGTIVRRSRAFQLSPWIPSNITPRAYSVVFTLSTVASMVESKEMRQRVNLALAMDLLWDGVNSLEQNCAEIWNEAMAAHSITLCATKEWPCSKGEREHFLSPHDLLRGFEAWVEAHPEGTQRITPMLRKLQGKCESDVPRHCTIFTYVENQESKNLPGRSSLHVAWELLRSDPESIAPLLVKYWETLGGFYYSYVGLTLLGAGNNRLDAMDSPGGRAPHPMSPTIYDWNDFLGHGGYSTIAAIAPRLSLEVLKNLGALAREYNWEWALASFDWENHPVMGKPIHPRAIFAPGKGGGFPVRRMNNYV